MGTITRVYPLSNPSSICLSPNRTSTNPPSYFDLTVNEVLKLSLVSMIQVLNITQLNSFGKPFSVPLKNLASTDEKLGRDYNIFTRLRSKERTALGYINYDISSGLQIIAFGILYKYASDPDLLEKCSMIFRYAWEPEYKKQVRNDIAKALGMDVVKVKKLLTSYANGSNEQSGTNIELTQFREESDYLRRQVISIIAQREPHILVAAQKQSKHDFSEVTDWKDDSESSDLARKKASVFFFIWTYFEKQIRDAMLTVVNDGIPVHDAIYSKRQLPFVQFEQAVLDETEFEVKIGN